MEIFFVRIEFLKVVIFLFILVFSSFLLFCFIFWRRRRKRIGMVIFGILGMYRSCFLE